MAGKVGGEGAGEGAGEVVISVVVEGVVEGAGEEAVEAAGEGEGVVAVEVTGEMAGEGAEEGAVEGVVEGATEGAGKVVATIGMEIRKVEPVGGGVGVDNLWGHSLHSRCRNRTSAPPPVADWILDHHLRKCHSQRPHRSSSQRLGSCSRTSVAALAAVQVAWE